MLATLAAAPYADKAEPGKPVVAARWAQDPPAGALCFCLLTHPVRALCLPP
jgi:hypothetical protein